MPDRADRTSMGAMEWLTMAYFLAYIPYVVITRLMATIQYAPFGRPLTGLEVLPAVTIISGIFTLLFALFAGWGRFSHGALLFGRRWPVPTRWTLASGVGTALLLFTVPLSLTFPGVSIPFMQLLMRGDVLIIAPLVDLASGRKVHWYSWAALGLVALGMVIALRARGGLYLPPLAIVTILLYTLGYFLRLWVMTRVAKDGNRERARGYFVEEKLVAIPVAIACLAVLSWSNQGFQGGQLAFGFVGVWSAGQLPWLFASGALLCVISVFALLILIDRRENSFCVPLERSASILAGLLGTVVLAALGRDHFPTVAEAISAVLLVAALVLLSLAPRLRAANSGKARP